MSILKSQKTSISEKDSFDQPDKIFESIFKRCDTL